MTIPSPPKNPSVQSILTSSYPDMLTTSEVADILRLTTDQINQLAMDGKIRCIAVCDKILIPKISLDGFLAKLYQQSYTQDTTAAQHLDNCTTSDPMPFQEGENEMAKSKVNQSVMINGERHWITAKTMQEFADKVGKILNSPVESRKHPFEEYARNWFDTYSRPTIETATAVTYKRQLDNYIIPAFQDMAVEDICTDDVQRLFNGMNVAKATKDKVRIVLNQILDAAVEDQLLPQNPLKSKRVKITGKASKVTVPYSVDQMRYLVRHIADIKNPVDRAYMALQALHPLRLEEVLGLQPEDVDTENMVIHIRRAVTHPTRNQPEVKDTKTDSSCRTIGLSALALPHLLSGSKGCFLFGGDSPLSYTQVRRMCDRIKRDIAFGENITPIRFRTTVLTDLYDQTKDIKLAQAAAGHTTPAMTLKYYVKGRETSSQATAAVERAYTA